MKYFSDIFALLLAFLLSSGIQASEKIRINNGWSFSLSDDRDASSAGFDDSSWRVLDLPHDWAFENGYAEDGAQQDRGGYASGGVGWYRKVLVFSLSDLKESRHFLYFEGVYMNSEVWVNGYYLGKRPYGYVSFEYEITQYIHEGENTVSVRVDNTLEPSARWYHGCGIYGSVYLKRTSGAKFATDGIFVATESVSKSHAVIKVYSDLDILSSFRGGKLDASVSVYSPDGTALLTEKDLSSDILKEGVMLQISDPQLWDISSPSLYTAELKLYRKNKVLDEEKVRFGIRTVEWKPESGFWINGRNQKIHGVCEHLEGGPVGAAWTKDLMRWKLQLLKDMGVNSIRTAHNPQLPMFYDLCDEMGILVMDEFFDGWSTKATYDYGNQAFAEWWEKDLRATVWRDRNHPCIIIYSVGNETRGDVASELVRVCHEEDHTRLVTSGHSGSEFMDVFGVNGSSEKKTFIANYEPDGKAFVGTETPHTWQVRGYYRSKTWYRDGYPNKKQAPFEIPDLTEKEIFNYEWASPAEWTSVKQHYNSSYDNATVRITARHNIEVLRDKPWYSGSYRWTGFDYLGEAGYVHGGWPFRAFMGGVLDMAGFRKDHYYLYQAEWTDESMVHLLPHWTHPYMEYGTEVPVVAYTNAEEVELFFDGKPLGRHTKGLSWDKMAGEWLVPWKEGTLVAVAYNGGKEVARTQSRTSFSPSSLSVGLERLPDEDGVSGTTLITVQTDDSNGTMYPYGENRVYFSFPDDISVLSLENGNPTDVETNWNARNKNAFFGLLRAFVRVPYAGDGKVFHVASILGDKKLKISDRISIDVRSMDIVTGKPADTEYDVFYTLDGTEPDMESLRYSGSFSVKPETLLRAAVYLQGKRLFTMEERFGENEGIYWGSDISVGLRGIQAEMTVNKGFSRYEKGEGFQGNCYLKTESEKAELSFYQENDGADREVPLSLSFMHATGKVELSIYNNGKPVASEYISGTPNKVWKIHTFRIPVSKGANQISVVISGPAGNGIDWIELAE